MKKTNKSIKNKPINDDNRLKNICAWALIICIVLAFIGGILGSLSFFGVRKAEAVESSSSSSSSSSTAQSYQYSTSTRIFDNVAFRSPSTNTIYSGSTELYFNFSFYPGYFYFQICGGSMDSTQYSPSFKVVAQSDVYYQYSSLGLPNSFIPNPESFPNYVVSSCINHGGISYTFDGSCPLYATALWYYENVEKPIPFTAYLNNKVLFSYSSSRCYVVRFFFSENFDYNYFDLYIPRNSTTYLIDFPSSSDYYPVPTFFDYRLYSDVAVNQDSYNNGYLAGVQDTKYKIDLAYQNGKRDGIESANKYSFLGLISAVIDAPVRAFTSLFNFELLGVNLSAFMFGLLTLALIIFIVKLFLGGGSK